MHEVVCVSSAVVSSPPYVVGDVVANRYELVRPLGVGGMGVVWFAHDRVLNIEVALKLILHPMREAAARAQTEARAAARLAHPAVCRVIDYGRTERDDPYVVTELLTGQTLEELLEQHKVLPPIEAVRTLLPILDALESAHASGIVHRDVKPSNILLSRANRGIQPKLLDFGIARWIGDKSRHTTTGSVVGTPDYMSPEQARGSRDVGPATDLWAFCATLYETLSGCVPFYGENYNAVLWAIQNSDPMPIAKLCAADDALTEIVMRGLRRESDARWGSAAELARELSLWLLSQGIDTDLCGNTIRSRLGESEQASTLPPLLLSPRSRKRRVPIRAAAAMLVAVSIAATASYAFTRAASAGDETRSASQPEPVVVPPVADAPQSTTSPPRAPVANPPGNATPPSPAPVRPVALERRAPPPRAVTPPSERVAPPAATVSEPPVATPTRIEQSAPSPRKTNALGYDFGL